MTIPADLTGQRFGMLEVKSFSHKQKGKRMWVCLCDCGNTKVISGSNLVTGNNKACGCLRDGHPTHGMANKIPEYSVWKGMWRRCTDPNHKDYPAYKDRTPPDEWRDFKVFLDHIGTRPSDKHSIERLDNNKPYGPGNVVWATRKEQNSNKRSNVILTFEGKSMTMTQWAEHLGIGVGALQARLSRYKMSVSEALTLPIGYKHETKQ